MKSHEVSFSKYDFRGTGEDVILRVKGLSVGFTLRSYSLTGGTLYIEKN